ncbi:MAG: amino acid ABC transporter ATP-binding protein [Comamonadaceae bacterium]|nr:MAG: amino acid ABC transporter ATP-binding protein [Comamonadaceae bacterium]
MKGVSLTIRRGEVVVVMGPSGSGKTTFIRCLNFLETPDQGDVRICGSEVTISDTQKRLTRDQHQQIRDIRRKTAMVFQSFNLFVHMTVIENIIEGPVHTKGVSRESAVAQARKLLQQVGLSEKENEYPSRLSGGQKQRVAIARALAMNPEVILFDEPTSALDPELRDEVLSVMRKLAEGGMTMIVVTHEVRFAREVADRVIFMEGGVVVEDAPSAAFFDQQANERVRQFLRRVE